MKDKTQENLPGPLLPNANEAQRLITAIKMSGDILYSWSGPVCDRLQNRIVKKDFQGLDWGFWATLLKLSRLVESAQREFALDMHTLKSPYMPKKEV